MTQTITRGIRLAITETLAKYGIDNIMLDMELTRVITDIVQEKKEKRTTEQIKQATEDALFASFANTSIDYAQFREELRPYAEKFCTLWKLPPPARPRKANPNSEYSQWIRFLEELKDACGEYGSDLLDDMYKEWRAGFKNGRAPFSVNTPGSITKSTRGIAGIKRQGIQTQNRLGV